MVSVIVWRLRPGSSSVVEWAASTIPAALGSCRSVGSSARIHSAEIIDFQKSGPAVVKKKAGDLEDCSRREQMTEEWTAKFNDRDQAAEAKL